MATDAKPKAQTILKEESALDQVIAATPEVNMREIWAGKDQRFTTYDGRICTLSIKLCETVLGNPYRSAPEAEKAAFIAFCITNGLDPLRKQVHFVKYGQDPAAYIVDWHVFVDRAQRHPEFDGYETGIVWAVTKGDATATVTERGQPCDYERDENHRMIGGWARVHRRDRKIPVVVEVPLAEMEKTKRDGTPTRFWKGMTTTMATKVPAARALRNSFPDRLGDLYIEQETAIFQALQQPDLRSGDTLPMETLDDLKAQLDAEDAPAKPEADISIAPEQEAGTDDEGGTEAPSGDEDPFWNTAKTGATEAGERATEGPPKTTTKLLTGLEDKDKEPH
jgi:phage recombination protein Bet